MSENTTNTEELRILIPVLSMDRAMGNFRNNKLILVQALVMQLIEVEDNR